VGATLAIALLAAPTPVPPEGRGVGHHASTSPTGDAIDASAQRGSAVAEERAAVPAKDPGRRPEFRRAAACRDAAGVWVMGGEDGSCPPGIDNGLVLDCADEEFRQPLWRRYPVGEDGWTQWQQVDVGGCGEALPVLTLEEFRRLPLAAPVLRLQPDRGWVLVNKETIVMTERVEQTFVTNLLGRDVEVVASPQRFHYEFGDGTDLWTTSAGSPYPNHDTYRVYEQPGTVQITLTTEWSGRYRVAGDDTWHAVTGTAQTSTTSAPFEVVERRSRLVDDLCTDIPKPADC